MSIEYHDIDLSLSIAPPHGGYSDDPRRIDHMGNFTNHFDSNDLPNKGAMVWTGFDPSVHPIYKGTIVENGMELTRTLPTSIFHRGAHHQLPPLVSTAASSGFVTSGFVSSSSSSGANLPHYFMQYQDGYRHI